MFETETVKYKTNTDCYWILLEDYVSPLSLDLSLSPTFFLFM